MNKLEELILSSLRTNEEETISEIEEGKEVDNTLFDFSPSIEGKLTWIDKKTIEFKPAVHLNSNYDLCIQ